MEEKLLHIGAVTEFVWWIKLGSIPAEWPATYEEVSAAYVDSSSETADLTEYAEVFTRLNEVQQQKKLLGVEEDELKATIGLLLKDNQFGVVNGKQVVSWKPQSKTSFDSKLLASEKPELFSQYQKTSQYRVMRFKGEK
jgi:predicted phage-related endonuclease